MTIYLFYKLPDKEDGLLPYLYAYTEKKDYAERFKKDRNPKVFYIKKKKVNEKEYKLFLRNNPHRHLSIAGFYTRNDFAIKTKVKVLCTWAEEQQVVLQGDKIWNTLPEEMMDISIFQSKYIEAIEKLHYVKLYRYIKQSYLCNDFYEPYYNSYGPVESFIEAEKEAFQYDELALFFCFFGETLKKK